MAFDAQAKTFSLPNAQVLGQASAIAYQPEATCKAWAHASGFDAGTLAFFDHRDTQGFVVENGDAVVVAFRGTQPDHPIDWFMDLAADPERWDHGVGKVHRGFYKALKAVWGVTLPNHGRILPDRLKNRGARTVWITGHSLGGALAELCAAQAMFVDDIPVQGVYTFGQPRVGNNAFASAVNERLGSGIYRIVNDRDIVPRVPLFSMGFCHYGNSRFFDHTGAGSDSASSVETLREALKFLAGSFNFALAGQVTTLLAGAISQVLHHELTEESERGIREQVRQLLRGGIEKIEDHDMVKHYLSRLDTSIPRM